MLNKKIMVQGVLSKDAFVMVNKRLARFTGFTEAGILGELMATHNMCENKTPMSNGKHYDFYNAGEKGEWFYLTQPSIEENLGITRTVHDTAIKNLIKKKLVQKKQMGLPAKSYYLINWDLIFDVMNDLNFGSKKEKKAAEIEKTAAEPLVQSGCRIPASLNEGILQPRSEESRIQDVRNPATIKKNYKKELEKEINKNLSIPEEINNLLDPTKIQPDWIEGFYKIYDLYSDLLSVQAFRRIISRVKRTKNINDIESYLITCCDNELNPKERKEKKSVRKEILPDWFQEDKEERQKQLESNTVTIDMYKQWREEQAKRG